MIPLKVTARLAGPVCMPERQVGLDGLLAAAVCVRDGIAPALTSADLVDVEIPVQRSGCGRYYLSSVGEYEPEAYALRYLNKRSPVEQFQTIGSHAIKRVDITSGVNKSYRIPLETVYLVDDLVTWWCVGDRDAIERLLPLITHLGKKRSVGLGRVASWAVGPTDGWPGFPVLRAGKPLRNLPADLAGVSNDADRAYAVMTPPYWRHEMEELCAVPRCHR